MRICNSDARKRRKVPDQAINNGSLGPRRYAEVLFWVESETALLSLTQYRF